MRLLFVTGSRGEWGYIRPIIDICRSSNIEYGICATNMLLLEEHGLLVEEIEEAGYNVCFKPLMSYEGSNHFSMTKSLGSFMSSMVDLLMSEKPTWVVLAGDRGEQFVAATACAYTYIPTAHIQAGEKSGNIDGVIRHAIGKIASIHFAANKDAAERLRRLGEQDFRIHQVGAPQIDELVQEDIPSADKTFKKIGLPDLQRYVLAVLHPVTEDIENTERNLEQLLEALKKIDREVVWIYPNNDAGAQAIISKLRRERTKKFHMFSNMSRVDYLSLLKHADCILGNSSSGLLEAPTFKTACVNIGRRQKDRVQGENVINCNFETQEIIDAFEKTQCAEFRDRLLESVNPYGKGDSSRKILDILKNTPIDAKLLIKQLTC